MAGGDNRSKRPAEDSSSGQGPSDRQRLHRHGFTLHGHIRPLRPAVEHAAGGRGPPADSSSSSSSSSLTSSSSRSSSSSSFPVDLPVAEYMAADGRHYHQQFLTMKKLYSDSTRRLGVMELEHQQVLLQVLESHDANAARVAELEALIAQFAGGLNARGATPEEQLQHAGEHVREVGPHGVSRGLIRGTVAASAWTGEDLSRLPPGLPMDFNPKEFEDMEDALVDHVQAAKDATDPQTIIDIVFD